MRRQNAHLAFLACVALTAALAEGAAAQDVFEFALDAGQEVPPTASIATGSCVARLNPTETQLSVTCGHDVVGVTGAHIHNAASGVNGPIVFPFASPASPFRGTWALSPADVDELVAGNLYVNVHSGVFPSGAIRGQIAAPATTAFAFALEGGQEVPANASAATGACDAVLDDTQTELTTACSHDVAAATGAHIHVAPPGVNGPIVFPFASPASPIFGVWELTGDDVIDLLAGELYVNVHSPSFPGGEIRGQLLPAVDVVFGDGFETGDTGRWNATVP